MNLKTLGGLVLVLLVAALLAGCGGRGDNITNPPPPGDGGGNNPPPYNGPAWTLTGPDADGWGTFKAVVLGTSCGTEPNDVSQYYLGGILSWDNTDLMPHGVKTVENGWVFNTYRIPPNTPDKDVAFPTNIAGCYGDVILTDASTVGGTNPKYHVPFSQHTRQDGGGGGGGGNPSTYLDVLSGSTDSTVTKDAPFKLSNPAPNVWHIRQWTNGANLPGLADQDRTHYGVTVGGPLFSVDPPAVWESSNVIMATFSTPPDGQYAIWFPLWDTNGNNVGSAWAIGSRIWGAKFGQLVQWQSGHASWFYPPNAPTTQGLMTVLHTTQ